MGAILTFGVGVGQDKHGANLPQHFVEKSIYLAIEHMSIRFGGCFVVRGDGGWVDRGKLIEEKGIQISIHSEGPIDLPDAELAGDYLRELFRQKVVLMSIHTAAVKFV